MGFHERPRFPDDISYDSSGGPGFNTGIITSQSGREERIQRWSAPRWQFNVAYGIRSNEQLAELKKFFIGRAGATFGFRYKDWTDYSTAANDRDTALPDDQLLGIGDGVNRTFQLRKKYESGATVFWRKLTKPVEDTILASLGGVPTTAFTVDLTTGLLTTTTAPGIGVEVHAGCEFDVPVRFAEDVDKTLQLTLNDFGIGSSENIPLIELVDESSADEDFNYRGADEKLIGGNLTISVLNGFLHAIEPEVDGLALVLQDPADLPPGGPYFHLCNESLTFNLEVRNEDNELLATMAPQNGCLVNLAIDGFGDRFWYTTT